MMDFYRSRLIYLLMFLSCYSVAQQPTINPNKIVNQNKIVTIAAEDNWPPFSDERGRGLSTAIVSKAYKLTGYELKTVAVPYARALHYAELNTTDGCWNVTRQRSTEQKFLLHQVPLFKAASSFYYYKSAKPYASVADIPTGAVVGVILGYEYGDLYEEHKTRFHLVEVSNHEQLLALLNDNKLDLAIFFDDVLNFYLKRLKRKELQVVRGKLNFVSEIYVAFNRDDPHNKERAAALDHGIRLLHETGDYKKLLIQFGVEAVHQ